MDYEILYFNKIKTIILFKVLFNDNLNDLLCAQELRHKQKFKDISTNT